MGIQNIGPTDYCSQPYVRLVSTSTHCDFSCYGVFVKTQELSDAVYHIYSALTASNVAPILRCCDTPYQVACTAQGCTGNRVCIEPLDQTHTFLGLYLCLNDQSTALHAPTCGSTAVSDPNGAVLECTGDPVCNMQCYTELYDGCPFPGPGVSLDAERLPCCCTAVGTNPMTIIDAANSGCAPGSTVKSAYMAFYWTYDGLSMQANSQTSNTGTCNLGCYQYDVADGFVASFPFPARCCNTASPTRTPSKTPSVSVSGTASASVTRTASKSRSQTSTPLTQSASETRTPSETASGSPTRSVSRTRSLTSTASASSTRSHSQSGTGSATSSQSRSATTSATESRTPTPSPTATRLSRSNTPTPTPLAAAPAQTTIAGLTPWFETTYDFVVPFSPNVACSLLCYGVFVNSPEFVDAVSTYRAGGGSTLACCPSDQTVVCHVDTGVCTGNLQCAGRVDSTGAFLGLGFCTDVYSGPTVSTEMCTSISEHVFADYATVQCLSDELCSTSCYNKRVCDSTCTFPSTAFGVPVALPCCGSDDQRNEVFYWNYVNNRIVDVYSGDSGTECDYRCYEPGQDIIYPSVFPYPMACC